MQSKPYNNYNRKNHQRQASNHQKPYRHRQMVTPKQDYSLDTRVFALGGLNEVGKNMYCIEHENELIIIDAGVKFAEEGLPGIDYVIPDYSYLVRNQKKIRGLFITHGHEDHIGGIPFLLQVVSVPFIYASPLAAAMIRKKLEEKRLTNQTTIVEIHPDSSVKTKHFNVGFFRTNHSIPESCGIVINTPNGRVVTTGDFKFDLTPVGEAADFQIMSFLGISGVTLLMSDSTNSEIPNFSISEKKVAMAVMEEFRKTTGRILVATFASNVHRVQQIVDAGIKFNRKILVLGRSMESTIQTARKLGYIKCPDHCFIKPEEVSSLPDHEVLILCTGSQGETLAALSRIAAGTHRYVSIKSGDTVLFSSSPIPGNAASINIVVNKLYRHGARVLTNSAFNNLHTSGHAGQNEQKLMLLLTQPKYFFPVHGEYRMLKIHAESAKEVGIPADHSFILSNGDVISLRDGEARFSHRIHVDDIYVDGNDISGLSTAVLRDRQILSEDGMVSVMVSMDSRTGKLLSRPIIISRGFIYMKDNTAMIREAELLIQEELSQLIQTKTTFSEIKNTIRDKLSSYFYRKTKRNPIIIPVIMNKKML